MKSVRTFFIGLTVVIITLVQLIVTLSWQFLIGAAIGAFFMFYGWKIGWTRYRNLTVLLGHVAVAAGCLVTAYAVYQIPSMKTSPTFLQVLNLPLFWGLFAVWGGNCMITHGYCSCAMSMNRQNNGKSGKPVKVKGN